MGIGATDEEATGTTKEVVDASISGWTIMLDGLSMNCAGDVILTQAARDRDSRERESRERESRRRSGREEMEGSRKSFSSGEGPG